PRRSSRARPRGPERGVKDDVVRPRPAPDERLGRFGIAERDRGPQRQPGRIRRGHRNWPGEVSVSPFHTTATTSPGSITAHPLSRWRRISPSGRISTPVSFLFTPVANPIGPILFTTRKIDPDRPTRGSSRSRIVSAVMSHYPHAWLRE